MRKTLPGKKKQIIEEADAEQPEQRDRKELFRAACDQLPQRQILKYNS